MKFKVWPRRRPLFCYSLNSGEVTRSAVILVLFTAPVFAEDAPHADSVRVSADSQVKRADPVADWLQDTLKPASQTPTLVRRSSPVSNPAKSAGAIRATDLLWPLVLVLLAIAVTAWLFRRCVPRGHTITNGAGINVLARHHLSNRQSLCLVRIGRRIVFVGVTPEQITTLTEIPEGIESAEILSSIQSARSGSFASSLAKLMSGDAKKNLHPSAEPA